MLLCEFWEIYLWWNFMIMWWAATDKQAVALTDLYSFRFIDFCQKD